MTTTTPTTTRPLAVVTGASSGIGYHLDAAVLRTDLTW